MLIQLFKIDYTIDNSQEYSANVLAENGEAAIKKIVSVLQNQIVVRGIETVCSGIQLATDKIVEIIAAPLLQKTEIRTDVKEEKPKKVYKCPYCDMESGSTLGIASHKRYKHPTEWAAEKNEN